MKMLIGSFLFFFLSAAGVSQSADLMTNADIGERIRELAKQGEATRAEQVKLMWTLVLRDVQGEKARKYGRDASERLKAENPLEPKSMFAFGYFRLQEAFDTLNPVTRKQRIDEGRRNITEALRMGGRDAGFLFDAGLIAINMRPEADVLTEGVNAMVLSKRMYGDQFVALDRSRQADWWAAMADALSRLQLVELARDHYESAASLSPESPSGRKAISWLRSHGR